LVLGTSAFSFSTIGCNFRCEGCQNWEISQTKEVGGLDFHQKKL